MIVYDQGACFSRIQLIFHMYENPAFTIVMKELFYSLFVASLHEFKEKLKKTLNQYTKNFKIGSLTHVIMLSLFSREFDKFWCVFRSINPASSLFRHFLAI